MNCFTFLPRILFHLSQKCNEQNEFQDGHCCFLSSLYPGVFKMCSAINSLDGGVFKTFASHAVGCRFKYQPRFTCSLLKNDIHNSFAWRSEMKEEVWRKAHQVCLICFWKKHMPRLFYHYLAVKWWNRSVHA